VLVKPKNAVIMPKMYFLRKYQSCFALWFGGKWQFQHTALPRVNTFARFGKDKKFYSIFSKIADSKESVFGRSSQQAKHPELNKFNSGCSSAFLKV